MIGEIGGDGEERAAEFIKLVDGQTRQRGHRRGNCTPRAQDGPCRRVPSRALKGTAKAKMEALTAAGVRVAKNPTEAGELMVELVRAFQEAALHEEEPAL